MKLKQCLLITWLFDCWLGTVICHEDCEEPSDRLLTHALMLNGLFVRGNPKDSEKPSALQELEFFSLRPVDIPVLQPGIIFYYEYQVVGRILAQKFLRLTETPEGLTKYELFACSDPSKFVPGTFEIANLTSVQESDIGSPLCTYIHEEQCNGNFVELYRYPVTCHRRNIYKNIWTCDAMINRYPTGEQIVRMRYGGRYPLSPYLKEKTRNFHFQCRNSKKKY